jgi:uncharacterized protein (DUF3084 family)
MGTYGILLILVLVLVSGFIAYIGDILGRRLGRRRVTLFGLRPRHTAIAVSIVAGMLTTLATLLIAFAVSKEVRIGLTQVDSMIASNNELKQQLRINEISAANARKRFYAAEDERKQALKESALVKNQLDKTRQQVNVAKGKITTAEIKLSQSQHRLEAVEKDMQRVDARLGELHGQFNKVNLELTQKQGQLKKAEQSALTAGGETLKLREEIANLTKQRSNLADQRTALTTELDSLQEQAASLRGERESLSTEVARLTNMIGLAQPVMTQEVIFGVGQEVGRSLLDANQPISDIRQQLEQFVKTLQTTAITAGAGTDPNGSSVIIFRMLPDNAGRANPLLDESEILDTLARSLHGQGGSLIGRAFSLFNVSRGQPVPIDFYFVQNRLLFERGKELASIEVNPKRPQKELISSIFLLLSEEVSSRARRANILPDLPAIGERSVSLTNPRAAVGKISFDRILTAVEEIKRHKKPVRVVVRAAKDLWTLGPLDVELAIVEPPARISEARN